MIMFYNLATRKPEPGQQVLIKCKDKPYGPAPIPYYVCNALKDENDKFRFEEAGGEQYSYYTEDEVEGWLGIQEFDSLVKVIEN